MNIFGLFGILDVVIVLVVVLFLVLGWKKGFLEKVIDMASSIFGLVASVLLARPFSGVLRNWIGDSLGTSINDYLYTRLDDIGLAAADLTENNLREALEGFSLPNFMVDWIAESVDYNSVAVTIVDSISPLILSLALLVIAFITLFFGSMIVFWLLKLLAKGITSIPVIKQVDKVFGLLFGFLKVALLVYILLFVLALVINIPAINDLIYEFLAVDMQLASDKFRLSKYLYDNNLLKNVINVFVSIL